MAREGVVGRNEIGVLVETDIDRWVKWRYRRRGRRLERPDTGDLGVVDDRRQRIIRRRCGTLARHVNGNGDHAFVDVDAYSLLLDIHLAKAPEKRHVAVIAIRRIPIRRIHIARVNRALAARCEIDRDGSNIRTRRGVA